MNKLAFKVQNSEAYVKVFVDDKGYEIESQLHGRKPEIIKTSYKNSELFNNKTKWNNEAVLMHAIMEEAGIITANEDLN